MDRGLTPAPTSDKEILMTRRILAGRIIPLLLVGISCAFLTGCAGFQTQSAFVVYKAPLDSIELSWTTNSEPDLAVCISKRLLPR